MDILRRLTRKTLSFFDSTNLSTSSSEQSNYLRNGSAVLEELLALCDGNCRIPLRYFTATEIKRATKHPQEEIYLGDSYIVTGLLDNRHVLLRFFVYSNVNYNIFRDIAITAQMSHLKNVLRLVGCCLELEAPVMVYEYVEAVTLDDLLFERDNHGRSLSWGSRLQIANEIASAVVFLHSEFKTPIIHRHLKPSNVIIDKNTGVAKLVDFSLSISLPPGECQVEDDVVGAYGYADPEYLQSGIITQKSDVYSFGVVLFELLTGKKATTHITDRGLMRAYEAVSTFKSIIEGCNVIGIVDLVILEEHGIGIEQQLEDYFALVGKCISLKGDDRPYMIDVARELRRIHKCFHALSLGQD